MAQQPAALLPADDRVEHDPAGGENRWSSVDRDTLGRPYLISLHGNPLAVADSGNNRVLIWRRG